MGAVITGVQPAPGGTGGGILMSCDYGPFSSVVPKALGKA
jgi:hypothetical protein